MPVVVTSRRESGTGFQACRERSGTGFQACRAATSVAKIGSLLTSPDLFPGLQMLDLFPGCRTANDGAMSAVV